MKAHIQPGQGHARPAGWLLWSDEKPEETVMDIKSTKQAIGSLEATDDRRVWAVRKQVLDALNKVRSQGEKFTLKRTLRKVDERLLLV